MRRDQLEHAVRTACQIIGRNEVIVVGSQAILGTYDEDALPTEATMSVEIDILPIAASNAETAQLADLIEGVAGEFSSFEELHGFSIDGVDLDTAILPAGWRDRLVRVQNANTAAPSGEPQFVGWCLDKEDLSSPLKVWSRTTTTSTTRPTNTTSAATGTACQVTTMVQRLGQRPDREPRHDQRRHERGQRLVAGLPAALRPDD